MGVYIQVSEHTTVSDSLHAQYWLPYDFSVTIFWLQVPGQPDTLLARYLDPRIIEGYANSGGGPQRMPPAGSAPRGRGRGNLMPSPGGRGRGRGGPRRGGPS